MRALAQSRERLSNTHTHTHTHTHAFTHRQPGRQAGRKAGRAGPRPHNEEGKVLTWENAGSNYPAPRAASEPHRRTAPLLSIQTPRSPAGPNPSAATLCVPRLALFWGAAVCHRDEEREGERGERGRGEQRERDRGRDGEQREKGRERWREGEGGIKSEKDD